MWEEHSFVKWIAFVREALSCLDMEKLTWIHLPSSGGYYDQDEFLLTVWNTIRNKFASARNDQTIIDALQTRNKGK